MNKLLITLSLFSALSANAEQLFQARTGQTINASISTKELTRIQVSGFPIIKAFTSAPIVIKKDTVTGQLYILPNNIKNGFNVFIVDKNGDNFNLYLTPSKNHVGDSIVIMPDASAIKKSRISNTGTVKANSPYSRNINEVIQLMFINMDSNYVSGYEVIDINQIVPMWKNVQVNILKQYSNNLLDGFVYTVTNNTKDRILLDEAKFFHKGVLAIAIEVPSLEVGDTTRVFIVQERVGE